MATKRMLKTLTLTGAITALAACGGGGSLSSGGDAAADDTLTIGLLVPETGVYAPLGEEMKQAAKLYLKEHDNEIAGQKVELVVGDAAGDPETGKSKAREMILNRHVDVLTGVVASPVAATVADEAKANKIPFVVANAGADALTGPEASEYVWRVSQSNYGHGYAAGVYAAKHVSTTGGVFMGADYAAGTETRDGFVAGFESGGGKKLDAQILTPFGKTQNFQPFLSRVPKDAKFVYAFYAGGEAITFQKNWANFGYQGDIPLIGAQNLTDEDILPTVGKTGVGTTTVGLYAPALDNSTNKAFVSSWEKAHKAKPSIIAVTTTDAFQFIAQAAEKADGDVDAASITKALPDAGEIDSPRGTFTVDPETHNPVQTYYARTLKAEGGSFVNEVVAEIPDVTGVPAS